MICILAETKNIFDAKTSPVGCTRRRSVRYSTGRRSTTTGVASGAVTTGVAGAPLDGGRT